MKEDSIEYTSNNDQANMMLIRAISEIVWWEKMEILMPMVAMELIKAGVKFPK